MAALCCVFTTAAPVRPAHGAEPLARSPFAIPYNVTGAVQMLGLKGVIRTDRYSGIIVQVGESENLSVFRVGNRIRLDLEERVYEFTVAAIKEKSAVFKGSDGKNYEVTIR